MHVYVWEHSQPLLQNRVMDVYETLVGMKCSWPGTCIKMFWPYLPRADPGRGKIGHGQGGGGSPSSKNFFFKLEGYSNKPNS